MNPSLPDLAVALVAKLSSPTTALLAVARLIGFAVLVASLELVWSWRCTVGVDGLLPWAIVRREHEYLPPLARRALDAVLGARGFVVVVAARLLAAFALVVEAERARAAAVVVFVTSLLVSIRFRGRENGASDALMNLVALALAVAAVARCVGADVDRAVVVFVAAQALLSYVAAGLAKLRAPAWRSGTALAAFVAVERFGVPAAVRRALGQGGLGAVAGYGVIAWQLTSPLSLSSKTTCVAFCAVGVVFHVGNFVVFGLNRFVFAWLSTYPALICCAALLSR